VLGLAALCVFGVGAGSAAASTADVQDGAVILITGDNNDDAIRLNGSPSGVTISDTGTGGITPGAGCAAVNAQAVTCAPGPGQEFVVYAAQLGNGTDSLVNENLDVQGQVIALSATGAKTLTGGPGPEQFLGGVDDDVLSGGGGDDFLYDGRGPAGFPTGGNDVLDGGPGADTAVYGAFIDTPPLSLTLDGIANDGEAGETDNLIALETIAAGTGDDTLVGDAASNTLIGGPGADTVTGLGGNDELFGEGSGVGGALRGLVLDESSDILNGGPGRDGLDCGVGLDVALRDPMDDVSPTCERTGAEVAGESAAVSGKRKAKILLECPASEGIPCAGRVELLLNGKKVGKGKFTIAAGEIKRAKAKLTKKGLKALKKAGGSLFVTVNAFTDEPGGVTQTSDRILIYR
jgi:Ca2+-binding RTX toxin-like protein